MRYSKIYIRILFYLGIIVITLSFYKTAETRIQRDTVQVDFQIVEVLEKIDTFTDTDGIEYIIYKKENPPIMLIPLPIPVTVEIKAETFMQRLESGEITITDEAITPILLSLYIPGIPYIDIAELDIVVDSSYIDTDLLSEVFIFMMDEVRKRRFKSLRVTMNSENTEEIKTFFKKWESNNLISNLRFYPSDNDINLVEFSIIYP